MNRKDCRTLIALFALPALFLSGTLLSQKTFFMRDLIYLFHPWRNLAGQMIQAGDFPSWNPYAMGGMPFMANCQSAIFYPFSLPFWSLGFASSLKLFHWIHLGIAASGFFILARKMKVQPAAGAIGSILFAFNGYMLTRLEFLSVLGAVVWFPWIAVLGSAGRNRGSFIYIALGLALTVAFLSGYPQVFLLGAAAAFFFSIIISPSMGTAVHWIKAGILFLVCAAAQLIPTLELIKNSVRGSAGIAMKEAATYSLPIDSLFGLIYPYRILHHPDRFTGEKYFWIWSGWWGISATTLIAAAFLMKKNNRWIYPAILGLIGAAWSMGDQLPFFQFFFEHVAFVRLFRYPPVALYWTVIGAALLTLWAGQTLGTSERMSADVKRIVLACAGALVLLELQWYSRNIVPTVPDDFYRATFNSVRTSQKEGGTAMLSPKVNSVRRIPGATEDEAMLRFRAFLFDQTNLPYRIRTIVPSGEPLALSGYQRLYGDLVSAVSLDGARPILNLWNVTSLLTEDTLDASWELSGSDQGLNVYRNPQALGLSYGLAHTKMEQIVPKNIVAPTRASLKNIRWSARYEADAPINAVFSTPFYPGWKTYRVEDGAKRAVSLTPIKVQDYFLSAVLPAGLNDVFAVYDSSAVKWGLILSLCGLFFLAAGGFKFLTHYVPS